MGKPVAGTTLPQLAVFTDWAEQRLLMANVEAQLEKVLLLVLDDAPVARAVQEARDMLVHRPTVRQRLADLDSLVEDPDTILPSFTDEGPWITELPRTFRQTALRRPVPPAKEPVPDPLPSRTRSSESEPTDRELTVLKILCEGKSNQDIADALCISIHTVKSHVGRMIARFKCGDRAGLAVMAMRKGWIE